jgi:hypothetical protein
MAHEGVPLVVIQRQLGHSNLGLPAFTCRASTAAKSSPRSTDDRRRRSRPPLASNCGDSCKQDRAGRTSLDRPDAATPAWRRAGTPLSGASGPAFASARASRAVLHL